MKMRKYLEIIVRNIKAEFNIQYKENLKLYNKLNKNSNFRYIKEKRYPCLSDRKEGAGKLGCYFWQDLWAAQKLYIQKPNQHFDIGSRIDGFIGNIAVFLNQITLIDVRPLKQKIPNVNFICMDATYLNEFQDNSIESISALCSIEHFGLGRYGDEINPDGYLCALKSIQRVLKKDGMAYIAIPIGKEHLEFDAHRIFYASTIIEIMDQMDLIEFSSIKEDNDYIEYNVEIHQYDDEYNNHGKRFGLFQFKKK